MEFIENLFRNQFVQRQRRRRRRTENRSSTPGDERKERRRSRFRCLLFVIGAKASRSPLVPRLDMPKERGSGHLRTGRLAEVVNEEVGEACVVCRHGPVERLANHVPGRRNWSLPHCSLLLCCLVVEVLYSEEGEGCRSHEFVRVVDLTRGGEKSLQQYVRCVFLRTSPLFSLFVVFGGCSRCYLIETAAGASRHGSVWPHWRLSVLLAAGLE